MGYRWYSYMEVRGEVAIGDRSWVREKKKEERGIDKNSDAIKGNRARVEQKNKRKEMETT